jgi:Smg protein
LETDEFDEEKLKWVVLMVLFNQPGAESSYAWMEDFVYDDAPEWVH